MPTDAYYEFDVYRLDAALGVLLRRGLPVPMRPRSWELLKVFLTHPQKVLSTAFLIENAWDGVVSLGGEAVPFQIHELRQTLEDDARKPRFIENVPKRGYRFLPEVRRSMARTEATDLYEKARHLYHKSTANEMLKAIEYYKRVIAFGQEYVADAFAGIADCYVLLGTFVLQIMPATEAMELARQAALKAIAMDKELAEAHAALASVVALYDWDWAAAEHHYERALELPSNQLVKPLVRSWFALCLAARGDKVRARHEINRARADFPSSSVLASLSGRIAYLGRDPELATRECDEGRTLEEYLFLNPLFMGHALRSMEDYHAALLSFERACQLTANNPVCLSEIAHLHAIQGRVTECRAILEDLERASQLQYVSPYLFSHVFLGLGDHNQMFAWLEKTYEARGVYLIFLTTDPVYDAVRSDRRFHDLVKKVGFGVDFS